MSNTLTPDEQREGWELLFDGTSLTGWRGYQMDAPPADDAWVATDDGTLYFSGEGSGDLITEETFEDFELALEWKISPRGNSGIMYLVSEDRDYPWQTGLEMQVLDNEGHPDGAIPSHTAGALYDLYVPTADVTRPVGEWNTVRILKDGSRIEHWMNGTKIVETDLASDEFAERLAASKFSDMDGFARNDRGHIVLQDHDDPVWYRTIKIRTL